MSQPHKDRNVGFLGTNIFENRTLAQSLANNAKAINSSILQSSSVYAKNNTGFFSELQERFSRNCKCSCGKANTQRNSNVTKNPNSQKDSKARTTTNKITLKGKR